jgi:hypothetical protein
MLAILDKPWAQALIGFVLICSLAFIYTTCGGPKPELSQKQEGAVRATIATNQQQTGRDTARAQAAAASGATHYAAGTAYAGVATILHQQTKPHAKPTPSDTAAARLQRELSGY